MTRLRAKVRSTNSRSRPRRRNSTVGAIRLAHTGATEYLDHADTWLLRVTMTRCDTVCWWQCRRETPRAGSSCRVVHCG